jgi:hypothetical protein
MIFGYEMGSTRKKSVGSCSQVDPDSSDSMVSDYRLDDREIVVRSPAVVRGFSSSLCVQTGFEVHPASCPMGTGGSFPRD